MGLDDAILVVPIFGSDKMGYRMGRIRRGGAMTCGKGLGELKQIQARRRACVVCAMELELHVTTNTATIFCFCDECDHYVCAVL